MPWPGWGHRRTPCLGSWSIEASASRGPVPMWPGPLSDPLALALVEACRDGPRSLDQLVALSGAGVAPVAAAVAELLREGWLADEAGWLEVAVSGLPP